MIEEMEPKVADLQATFNKTVENDRTFSGPARSQAQQTIVLAQIRDLLAELVAQKED